MPIYGWTTHMKQNYSVTCIGLALFALAGCVTPQAPALLSMTYHSDPEGATLYLGGQRYGYAPVTLNYPVQAAFASGRCVQLASVQTRWASGVTSVLSDPQVCPARGWTQQYVLLRPAGPGADIDANFALQLQQNAIQQQRNGVMQQQADAQDATAVAEYLRSQKPH